MSREKSATHLASHYALTAPPPVPGKPLLSQLGEVEFRAAHFLATVFFLHTAAPVLVSEP